MVFCRQFMDQGLLQKTHSRSFSWLLGYGSQHKILHSPAAHQ